MNRLSIKRALISVSNKEGLLAFAQQLHAEGIEIISTGGTYQHLHAANIPVIDISHYTGFPEIMDGRLKTLHPKVHGGILGKREQHRLIAQQHGIEWIDLVVVNLYPFSATIQNPASTFEDAIENIDIGGPTMIRAAAKNMAAVGVVVEPADYESVLQSIKAGGLTNMERRTLATKAFQHTAQYDELIYRYLDNKTTPDETTFPSQLSLTLTQHTTLRYGENPHQKAAAYQLKQDTPSLFDATIHQGKALSYNNLVDAEAAWTTVTAFSLPTCVIVKHANPCGIATATHLDEAFDKAFMADATSAFGGIIALNQPCDLKTATSIASRFFEVVIAPGFSETALKKLAEKPNVRVLEMPESSLNSAAYPWHIEPINGGFLVQEKDLHTLNLNHLSIPTKRKPRPAELNELHFAWQAVKHVKSNAIVISKAHQTIGIGAGQVSRIDAVDIAIRKASSYTDGKALASDAFFPFRDSIDSIAKADIHLIIQPGGSIRDEDVIAACDEHNIAMVFTGMRCFKH